MLITVDLDPHVLTGAEPAALFDLLDPREGAPCFLRAVGRQAEPGEQPRLLRHALRPEAGPGAGEDGQGTRLDDVRGELQRPARRHRGLLVRLRAEADRRLVGSGPQPGAPGLAAGGLTVGTPGRRPDTGGSTTTSTTSRTTRACCTTAGSIPPSGTAGAGTVRPSTPTPPRRRRSKAPTPSAPNTPTPSHTSAAAECAPVTRL